MVYTSNAIITAILAVSAAAPILAAPLGSRVDSGISSVNNRAPVLPPPTQPKAVPTPALAPETAAKETASNVKPAVLNHHLAARGVEVEAGVKTDTAQSGRVLHSPIAQGLLGRTALAAISSILRREPEFADSLGHEPAAELKARSAIGSAITGGAAVARRAGFAVTNNLIQHLNRASTPAATTPSILFSPSEPSESSSFDPSIHRATSGFDPSLSDVTEATDSYLDESRMHSPSPQWVAGSEHGSDDEAAPLLPPSESTPSTGIVSKLTSLVNTPAKAILSGLTVGGVASAAGFGIAKALGHRDVDGDTVHLLGRDVDTDTLRLLLGRDLEDLIARSSGIDELD